jgi:hypothetical protein
LHDGNEDSGTHGGGSRAEAAWAWLTGSPQRIALTSLTVVGAIAAGVVLAIAIGGIRGAAATPSVTPSVTPVAATDDGEATATSTANLSPSATPSPTTTATSATPTPAPSATPAGTSAPAPSATPVATELRMAGTWERLPDDPLSDDVGISTAVRLDDGRIVAFYVSQADSYRGDCIATFSPDTEQWTVPDVERGSRRTGCFPTHGQFVLHPDGRLISVSSVVDPTQNPWQWEPSPWRNSEMELPSTIGSTGDGRFYGPFNFRPARLYELVLESGALEQVSEYADQPNRSAGLDHIVSGEADRLFFGTFGCCPGPSRLVSYDPDTDDWRPERSFPLDAWWYTAAHGPDGWIYVPTWNTRNNRLFDRGLWARDPDSGEWIQVEELPDDLPEDWNPSFVDGGDGRLYAIDEERSYVFTPEGVHPVPSR